jgi:hypothetical protein
MADEFEVAERGVTCSSPVEASSRLICPRERFADVEVGTSRVMSTWSFEAYSVYAIGIGPFAGPRDCGFADAS